MRRTVLPLLAVSVLAVAACSDAPEPLAPTEPSAAPVQPSFGVAQEVERVMAGRVLARLVEGSDVAAVGRAYGLEVERERPGYVMFRGAANGSERALAARMGGDVQVVWAEPDYLRQTTQIDPRLWAFHNPGGLTMSFTQGRNKGDPVTSFASVDDADEDNAENYAGGGQTVKIASIDTGVDFTHTEFLPGQLIPGWDYFSDDPDPTDEDGHGTHTTGTMVGRTVGVAGVSGAGAHVEVVVFRVCGPYGCPTSAIVDAIRAAADSGVVAMNLSLGGGSLAQSEADAITYATAKNALVVASAGNNGTGTVSCPACDPRAISVAASNWQDELTYYSNWGSGLDITAPGGQMYSNTSPEGGIYSSVPGGYAYYQGTSMAAPQVTGTAGIVASVDGLTGDQLRARLEGTTDDIGDVFHYGNGRLNSYRAVTGATLNEGGGGDPGGGGTTPTLTASFSYSCSGPNCSFDGSSSTGATSWDWRASDDWTDSGEYASHTFGAGDFTVTLTVHDEDSNTDSTSQTVQCKVRGRNGLVCN